jgi:hypothetical protein
VAIEVHDDFRSRRKCANFLPDPAAGGLKGQVGKARCVCRLYRESGLRHMNLKEHQSGVLLMFAGLSARSGGAPIRPAALKEWLQEEASSGTIDRETIWLFRTGYITTVDGDAYSVTEHGWAALDKHMIDVEEAACRNDFANGKASPKKPVLSARQEHHDVLILMGEFEIKAEAQRMTMRAFPKSAPSFRPEQ